MGSGQLSMYCILLYICLHGHSIERVDFWVPQISEVNRKILKVRALRRLRPICPKPVLIIIHKSLI